MDDYSVVCESGTLRTEALDKAQHFEHRWTTGGVDVDLSFTGAHLLHASVAACVLNDVYREAGSMDVTVHGVRVRATGAFSDAWASTGIEYAVEIDSAAAPDQLERLLTMVDQIAEIPRAIRQGAPVRRTE